MRPNRLLDYGKPEPTRAVETGAAATGTTEALMGRGILLWLIGVPIPVIIILALIWH